MLAGECGRRDASLPQWAVRHLAALVAFVGLASVAEAAAPVGQWWSASYRYRQKLNLTAGATAVPTQYSMRLQLDHAALVSVSQSLASGDDVRVAYWNGSAWVELDRLLDDQSAWNTATTQVWFRTQAGIGATLTDDNYYLYYGNPTAGAPPANWASVFLFYDNFNDGVFDAARWSCIDPFGISPPAACTESAVAPGTLSLQSDSAAHANGGFSFGTNTRWESRLRIASTSPANFYNSWGASDMVAGAAFPYQNDWTTLYNDTSQHAETANNGTATNVIVTPVTPTSFHVYTFDREALAGVRYFQDGTQLAFRNTNVPDANLQVLVWNDDVSANGIVLDWVRVRKYVTPEPTFTAAAVETGPSGMRVLSGTYTGNGVDDRAVYVGFSPDIVIVDMDENVTVAPANAVIRTSTMVGDMSKDLDGPNPLAADRIQSLTPTGFVIGTHATVNETGRTFHWVAFRGAPGELRVGSYLGDGVTDDRNITSLGFSPEYVIVMSDGAQAVVQRSSAMPGDTTHEFDSTGFANGIQALQADGFQVGLDPRVNAGATTYHFAAWNAVPGKVAVGVYTGDGATSRNITGVGVFPEWAHVTRSGSGFRTTHKPASTGVGVDRSLLLQSRLGEADNIQALLSDGFQVGGHSRVNSTTAPNDYYWAVFGPHTAATNYRSIGNTAVTYGTSGTAGGGTRVSVSNGSAVVAGLLGTTWYASNRGRGDVITIPCDDPPACTLPSVGVHYAILSVASDGSLQLSQPYQGTDNASASYLIRRQFATFAAWEDCVDGPPGTACPYFPVTSASLVADDRRETGIAYKDAVFTPAAQVLFKDAVTDTQHTITLTADGVNRHNGVQGAGVVIDGLGQNRGFRIEDSNYTVEWLEFRNIYGVTDEASILIRGGTGSQTGVLLQNLMIHDFFDGTANVIKGIGVQGNGGKVATIRNTMIWNGDQKGIEGDDVTDVITIENCTLDGMANYGIDAFHSQFTVRNTISTRNPSGDFVRLQADGSLTGSNNTSSDLTAAGPPAVFANNQTSAAAAALYLDSTGPVLDLHLNTGANVAVDTGLNLSASFLTDIDNQARVGVTWDRGADERDVTTAVRLQSFTAQAGDGLVTLEWRTASELDNLGFHVYRASSANGPWSRLTASLIPGLGSSAVGRAYSFRDGGLTNGVRYFYRLEDVDASSKTTSHGPVSAVPLAGAASESEATRASPGAKWNASSSCPDWVLSAYGSAAGSDRAAASLRCTRHGDPAAVSLSVFTRDARSTTLELKTGGFYALHEPSGTVRVFVPGFDFPPDEQAAALPVRRALADAVVGRRVQLGGVRALDLVSFKGLLPAGLGKPEMQVSQDGTVRATRRVSAQATRRFPRRELATLLPSLFQGEQKSAVVEIAPLRFEAQRQQLVLARRVLVRLLFTGRELGESGRGSLGRAPRARKPVSGEILARLYSTSVGLHAVSFEQLFPGRARGFAASQLRLERQGEPVSFHLEPAGDAFGPGSRLYFYAERSAASTDFTAEVAYELVSGPGGVAMPLTSAAPRANAVATASSVSRFFEANRFYQPGLLEAPDLWLWEALASGATRVKSFSLAGAVGSGDADLDAFLQGASESGQAVDHHVSVSVNGALVGEAQFAGKQPYRMSLSLPASLLREGANELALTNVADTGVTSLVFLDRFSLVHPQLASVTNGLFEGTWGESGTATVSGLTRSVAIVDVSAATGGAKWLSGYQAMGGSVRFHAEAGHRYLVASQESLLSPRVAAPAASPLRATTNQADYLLIAPRAFLTAAEPLVQHRQDQGLSARAVAFEEIADAFGHGQPSAEAIQSFLAYAFQSWTRPSPRYVLLLGDSSYDPRNFMGTSQPSPLPALWAKTAYLWTVSDPLLAAVNGEDALPDLAIGRLPAATVEQAQSLVEKLIAWEDSGQGLTGHAALVADTPDLAGDFEANVRDIAQSYFVGREPELLLLSELGVATRPRILDALDSGLSYLDYVGHGGAAVWASENVWNSWDASSLQAQSQQPLLLTLNCLNGYFVAPAFDSLSESLVKAEGRGAIAAFSPSGLSLDAPAHQYHRALMAELTGGRHARLGDAILAAQKTYADSGLMPELLLVYHLLGDPATRIGP